MATSFYSEEELAKIGFKSYGEKVLVSRHCSIYGASNISIGSNVRIDDFCILSGIITLGSNIHISAYTALYGGFGIVMEDYTGISQRCTLISASDDFSGGNLVGPIHPEGTTYVTGGPIVMKRFSHIAAHCCILPNVTIAEGCVIGAMSLVKKDTEPWTIYVGTPAKRLKPRLKKMVELVYENDKK